MLNVYDNVRSPQVKNFSSIEDWFDQIKKSRYSDLISSSRGFHKGDAIYESVKKLLPAITYNFTFHTKKENKNISGATGLLYIDVDDLSFDINTLDKNKVFAAYRSYGGLGYSILIRVDGLTVKNYDASYVTIISDLGLSDFYDENAQKCTQFNVLSYDPDIYINANSYVFEATNENVPPSNVVEKKEEAYTADGGTFSEWVESCKGLRYDNLDEIKIYGDYEVNWDGFQYVSCWIPMNKISKNRNNTLLAYGKNLLFLNPRLTLLGLTTVMTNVNNALCIIPVDTAQIKRIVKSVFSYKNNGTLKPIYNKKPRKIVFAKGAMLTADEKMKKVRDLLATKKSTDSKEKLYSIIENWDFTDNGKITIRAVAKSGKMSKKTIQKYWQEFKDYAAELNKDFKNSTLSLLMPDNLQLKKAKDNSLLKVESSSIENSNHLKPNPPMPITKLPLLHFAKFESVSMGRFSLVNYGLYNRVTKTMGLMERVMMEIRLDKLMEEGYQGKEVYETKDWLVSFDIDSENSSVTITQVDSIVKVA